MALQAHELESLHELEFEGEFEGLGELESELELELEAGEFETESGESEFEFESEFEGEFEFEHEISPVRKIYPDAMMEHLAHAAAEAETEHEAAEHFLPLVGMAASKLLPVVARVAGPALKRALPKVASAVSRVQPQLTRGIGTIARKLHRSPTTRRLLHAVPAIARRTVHSIANQAAHGRPITARSAVRTLARQTRRVLGHRPLRTRTLRRSRILDRRFHQHMGGNVRPHYWNRTWQSGQPGAGGPPAPAHRPAYGYGAPAGPGGRPVAGPPGRAPGSSGGWAPGYQGAACPPCPSCGGGGAAAAPAYCRCCGQVLR